MQKNLYTLAYFSKNTFDNEHSPERSQKIEEILVTARKNNRHFGITGALIYSSGCFAQVLEGPLSNLESTFERIQLDPRHCDVAVIHYRPIENRSFNDWSMAYAYIDPNAPERAKIDKAMSNPDKIDAGTDGLAFVGVLKNLILRNDLHQA